MSPIARILKPLASLRLTVVLFAMAMFLILAGTLAQVDEGIWTVVARYFRSLVVRVEFQLFVPRKIAHIPGAIIFPGGFLIASVMLVNLLAAHAIRFKFAAKRSGIILTHAGVILLLVGEFVTGLFATEGNMAIDEGETATYIEDIRSAELAVIDPSDPQSDLVVVVPQRVLAGAGPIAHGLLPFEIKVDQWMPNSQLLGPMQATPQQRALADSGAGTQLAAAPAARATGVEGASADIPSAYITLSKGRQPPGSYLVSVPLGNPQPVDVGGKTYGLALRFKRTYKPYSIHLEHFAHDKFVGTETPRNFSSLVRLSDPQNSVDREVLISMNHPLRYRGETFYQASFKPGDGGTVLQVVRNPGWLLPYISCCLVGGGMLLHFGMKLVPVLRRPRGKAAAPKPPAVGPSQIVPREPSAPLLQRLFPWAILALALLYIGAGLMPAAKPAAMDFDAFGRIPVSAQGRTKPLDTFARNTMMQLSGRQTYTTDAGTRPAIEWLADTMGRPDRAAKAPVFRIDHPDVLTLLGLGTAEGGRKRFSIEELSPKFQEIRHQNELASAVPAKQRDPFQRQITDLHDRLSIFAEINQFQAPYAWAPLSAGEEWRPFTAALDDPSAKTNASIGAYRDILTAYRNDDATGFNAAVARYLSLLGDKLPAETRRAGYEVAFNRFEAFYRASGLYVLAFLLAGIGFITNVLSKGGWARALARATVLVLIAALLVHTVGIVSRIYLQGRPPVTNLYSSAVFIGWVGVLIGLCLEWLYGLGLGSMISSVIGFATLVIAHNLSSTGDTMEMMQAVLDTNFWLATHVVVVTIGYSATFLAGFLGIAYILLGVCTGTLRSDLGKTLPKTVYGVICFASLASFVGTVLGGIWADQSWGRFWGWDPKENGAALIVLMNLLTLHARFGGMIRERGIAVLAVLGNIVTAWSWFGTNMLGVGLHSYGFMASAVFYLAAFMLSQLVIAMIGLIPQRLWRSKREPIPRADRPVRVALDPA